MKESRERMNEQEAPPELDAAREEIHTRPPPLALAGSLHLNL